MSIGLRHSSVGLPAIVLLLLSGCITTLGRLLIVNQEQPFEQSTRQQDTWLKRCRIPKDKPYCFAVDSSNKWKFRYTDEKGRDDWNKLWNQYKECSYKLTKFQFEDLREEPFVKAVLFNTMQLAYQTLQTDYGICTLLVTPMFELLFNFVDKSMFDGPWAAYLNQYKGGRSYSNQKEEFFRRAVFASFLALYNIPRNPLKVRVDAQSDWTLEEKHILLEQLHPWGL